MFSPHRLRPQPRAYLPWGFNQSASHLGFNGEVIDSASGTYWLGNGRRAYSPGLMRFFSPDSLSPFEIGGLNTYGYCGGDPVNLVDPSGQHPVRRPQLRPFNGRLVQPPSNQDVNDPLVVQRSNHLREETRRRAAATPLENTAFERQQHAARLLAAARSASSRQRQSGLRSLARTNINIAREAHLEAVEHNRVAAFHRDRAEKITKELKDFENLSPTPEKAQALVLPHQPSQPPQPAQHIATRAIEVRMNT